MKIVAGLAFACAVLALASAETSPPRVTWADWVGTYDAKLAWYQCTAPGAKSPALAIDAVDGVLSIDLAPASPGLRAMSLVADDHRTWSAQQGDVKVSVVRAGADRVDLVIELESGCVAKGPLKRAATGVPACDRLRAWARIESRCTKLTAAPLEDAAKLAKLKAADAPQCTKRADALERSLVDAGCAPHPDPLIGVRARDCLELAQASEKLKRCGRVPPQLIDRIVAEARGLASAAQTAERATLPYVEQQCRDARSTVSAVATQFGCPQ